MELLQLEYVLLYSRVQSVHANKGLHNIYKA